MSTATSLTPANAQPYTPDDLLWLREHLGGGHVELDPWGNAVVSPASDPHLIAITSLHETLVLALAGAGVLAISEGPPWQVPGGSGYTNMPDLVVLPGRTIGRHPDHEWHLSPPPLLVVEVASPSTRVIDRTRKAQDYLMGGAQAYLLHDGSSAARDVGLQVDLPGLAPVEEPMLELWVPRDGEWATVAMGAVVEVDLAGRTVALGA